MDDDYVRNGIANIFIEVGSLGGQRKVKITGQRRQTVPQCEITSVLQKQPKRRIEHTIEFAHMVLGLAPGVLNTIDVVSLVGK